jgi:hypothetical protein
MSTDAPPQKIFISYRRKDTVGYAIALAEKLKARYGGENVFLDLDALQPGTNWIDELERYEGDSGVLVALIGPQWLDTLWGRGQDSLVDPQKDYVKVEIETALQSEHIHVLPVLLDDATMPAGDELPSAISALAGIQAVTLRYGRWDDDVANLIEKIDQLPHVVGRQKAAKPETPVRRVVRASAGGEQVVPPPDSDHYDDLIRLMVEEGRVVPVLGSRVNASDREEGEPGRESLPDAQELAARLAEKFDFAAGAADLARVTQYVYTRRGKSDLCRALKEILSTDSDPSSVHRFLAGFPKALKDRGLPRRYQMIVTTNYDNALERAFIEAKEPYDLAVYMASGDEAGRFLHIDDKGTPKVISTPNSYAEFPIDDSFELRRTVIVKIHGGLVDNVAGPYPWPENYVITEDHYIDYLSRSPVESLIPVQILAKIRDSHCLFLGYTMRDWNLRVFLKRVWEGGRPDSSSWAVERDPDTLEKKFWTGLGVDLYAAPLADYVSELGHHLVA